MAVVLRFPTEDVQRRQRIENKIWAALEMHDPATREEKHRAVMETLDRFFFASDPIAVTLQSPVDEPFTDRQIHVIEDAMNRLRNECGKRTLSVMHDLIMLRLHVIDPQR